MSPTNAEEALEYHSRGRKGKLEVVATKPTATQRDLSLACSSGVAQPCPEIEKNPIAAHEYTAKGNVVAVTSFSNFGSNPHASAVEMHGLPSWPTPSIPTSRWTARCRPTPPFSPTYSKPPIPGPGFGTRRTC